MKLRLALAAVSAIALASPAFAQDTAQTPPPVEQPQRPLTPEEQAFQNENVAFGAMMDGLVAEVRTALQDPATNADQKMATVDSLIGARTPQINAFADTVQTFFTSQRAQTTDPTAQAEIDQILSQAPAGIRAIPGQIRQSVVNAMQQAQAQAAAGGGAVAGQPASGAVAGTIPQQ